MSPWHVLVVLVICVTLGADAPQTGVIKKKKAKTETSEKHQGLPYREGTVVSLSFVRTKPGMTIDYIRRLAAEWRKLNEQAKEEGLILSYKFYLGSAANKEDWDIMLLTEFKNMAALDGLDEKMDALAAKILGSEELQKQGYLKRGELREILGEKIVREVILK